MWLKCYKSTDMDDVTCPEHFDYSVNAVQGLVARSSALRYEVGELFGFKINWIYYLAKSCNHQLSMLTDWS